jgi:hypothetical protein
MTTLDIAWLAGVLEGEASFGVGKGSPNIQVQMTDEDIIERIRKLWRVRPRAPWMRKDGYKPVHGAYLHGVDAIGWMMTIYTFMGVRRREKIKAVIQQWRESSRLPRARRGERFPARCHPDRDRAGKGLCMECYMDQWRLKGIARGPQRRRVMCHPELHHEAHGLCSACYQREYKAERRKVQAHA